MKNVYAEYNEKEKIYVISFGTEVDSAKARWGRGQRNSVIIHYVLKGEGYFNGQKVKEGEGFVIPRNLMHEYYSSKQNPWQYFWVILNGEESESFIKSIVQPDERGIFLYDFKDELINFSKTFFVSQEKISHIKAMGIFYLLMSYHEKREKISPNRYVSEAEKYMEENLYRKLSVKEVADKLFISDRYLYNLFVLHEKTSPKKYLNTIRIRKAKSLLKQKKATVTEVAVSVGFSDVLTFSRFFKSHTGKSPTEYIKGTN